MFPVSSDNERLRTPAVTYTLAALILIIYLWDRKGNPFGASIVFADLAMRPREVVGAAFMTMGGSAADRFPLVTTVTSLFLHGNLTHLIGNLIFLVVFGAGVEQALGSARFALYYFFWGLAAAAAQIWVDPTSAVPVLGASGAIGGALGAYLLLYPASKIELTIPLLAFLTFELPAYVLLGGWFLWQVVAPHDGVANWAHVGGFVAGMVTILIMGGRSTVLRSAGLDPARADG